MPASPQEIAQMRKKNEGWEKEFMDKFDFPKSFFDTLDKTLSKTKKSRCGKYRGINLGKVYIKHQSNWMRDTFPAPSGYERLFAAKIKEAYENKGWKRVKYIYIGFHKKIRLYNITLYFHE